MIYIQMYSLAPKLRKKWSHCAAALLLRPASFLSKPLPGPQNQKRFAAGIPAVWPPPGAGGLAPASADAEAAGAAQPSPPKMAAILATRMLRMTMMTMRDRHPRGARPAAGPAGAAVGQHAADALVGGCQAGLRLVHVQLNVLEQRVLGLQLRPRGCCATCCASGNRRAVRNLGRSRRRAGWKPD